MTSPLQFALVGAPLTTTSAPTGSTPAQLSASVWTTPPGDGATSLYLSLIDGTSATIQVWFFATGTEWHKLGSAVSLSAALTLSAATTVPRGGSTLFAQITAIAGSPTVLRAGFWGQP